MIDDREGDADADGDAALASTLFSVDPFGLGGIVLRARAGADRDAFSSFLREGLPPEAPVLRVPVNVTEDRLLGGIALASTLREGRIVTERGILERAHGGVLVLPMAERLRGSVATHVCAALDRGALDVERDGSHVGAPCRIGVIALDEGIDDERPAPALVDRLAFHITLVSFRAPAIEADPGRCARARELLPRVTVAGAIVDALCAAASALGVTSLRGPLLAVAAARAHAALEGRRHVEEIDAMIAARLVLAPRATRMPVPAEEDAPAEPPPADDAPGTDAPEPAAAEPLEDVVLDAARSAIPRGLLDALALGPAPRARSAGKSGALGASSHGGRPAGVRAGVPRDGERLNVVETLRAAAPWQLLRRRERGRTSTGGRIEIRKADFRVTRYQQRNESSVIFSVDASGSAALQRLAEAKGAVEQVLADCYVRRDHVALIAFRGASATLLLSPTRSLARVRRRLAALAGGGTTPLASGIDAALALATSAAKSGRTPVIVLMTDARANVARDGVEGTEAATADALASARAVRSAGVRTLFLDTSPRPRAQARVLAAEMGAWYLPLPRVDAAGISRHVQALAGAPGSP